MDHSVSEKNKTHIRHVKDVHEGRYLGADNKDPPGNGKELDF